MTNICMTILAFALLAGACTRPAPPTMADFAAACQGYGFEPNTPAAAQCVQNESLAYQQNAIARRSAAIAAYSGLRTHTCVPMGGNVTCF